MTSRKNVRLYCYIIIYCYIGLEDSEDESVAKPREKKITFADSNSNPLLTDLDFRDKETKKIHKAELWFERDLFKNCENDDDEDYEINRMIEQYKRKNRGFGEDEQVKHHVEKEKRKRKISESDDAKSDYDVEEMMEYSNKKTKMIGGKNGFEVVSREKG